MLSRVSLLGFPDVSIFRPFSRDCTPYSRGCTVSIGVSKGYWSYELSDTGYLKNSTCIILKLHVCATIQSKMYDDLSSLRKAGTWDKYV